MSFNIQEQLNRILQEVGLSSADVGGKITFKGADPIYDDVLHLGAISALPTMACAVGAATIWKMRTGESQDLSVDLRKSIHNINPNYKFSPTINGFRYPTATLMGNPFLETMYRTRDGRYVIPTAVYPALMLKWLNFLKCQPNKESVTEAILHWNAQELEDAAAAEKLSISICRTPEEWLQHPAGKYLKDKTLITIEKIGESEPQPFLPAKRPLSGIRVLAPVHAIAGPTVVRSLTEYGADALQITTPNDFEHEMIYDEANIGIRSTWLDFNQPEQNKRAHELATECDVFVENYRTSVMRHFGFTPSELAEKNPGIIYVSVKCYGYGGPWGERAGFDTQGTAASGLTVVEGTPEMPKMPCTTMINDYVTGYFGAVGALAALIKRAKEGGSYHVKVNLTSNAMWCCSLGTLNRNELDFSDTAHHLLPPDIMTRQTALGKICRLASPVELSKTPGNWENPILVPRGSNKPEWLPRT